MSKLYLTPIQISYQALAKHLGLPDDAIVASVSEVCDTCLRVMVVAPYEPEFVDCSVDEPLTKLGDAFKAASEAHQITPYVQCDTTYGGKGGPTGEMWVDNDLSVSPDQE